MKNKFKYLIAMPLLASLAFTSCNTDDPEIPNEEELITTLVYTLTPQGGGTALEFRFTDLDGDGGNAPTITSDTLAANTVYTGAITLSNESETPAEDITEEVEEEDDYGVGEEQRALLVGADGYVDAKERKTMEKSIAARKKAEEKARQQYYDNLPREEKIEWAVEDFLAHFYASQLEEVWDNIEEAIPLIQKNLTVTATEDEIEVILKDKLDEKIKDYKKEELGLGNKKSKRRKIQLVAMIVAKEFPDKLELKSKRGYAYSDKDVERRRKELMNKTTMDGINDELRKYDDLRDKIEDYYEEEKSKEPVATIFKRLSRAKLKF